MTPNGPCVSPQTAHSCTTEDFLAIVHPATTTAVAQSEFRGGGGE